MASGGSVGETGSHILGEEEMMEVSGGESELEEPMEECTDRNENRTSGKFKPLKAIRNFFGASKKQKKLSRDNDGGNMAEHSVNVTDVRRGTVGTVVAGIVHGGMGNTIGTGWDHLKKLLERTKKEIEVMTAGMIRVSAVDDVINKMNTGQHWITITGNAGDGKTTLGYLVMKEFLQKKVKVFTIFKPEEYDQIADMEEDRIIMFDDRFGAFLADRQLIKSWCDVIHNILRLNKIDKPTTKVLFISRKNVLKESKVYLEHFTDDFFNKDCVLDLSKRNLTDERLMILEYHLGCEKVTIPQYLKHRVCNMQIAHGFPHCCKMFSKLKSKGYDVDIVDFFKSPLKFLDMTTRVLYYDNCKNLFQLMIRNDGQLDVYKTIKDEDQRHALLKVEQEQEGSYITVWINGMCKFAHPSVYESVLNVINDIDPLYCVKFATLSVIRQKMFISISDEEDSRISSCYIIVKPIPIVLTALAKRFKDEILKGDYSIFEHRLCKSREFCESLVSCCVQASEEENGSTLFINRPGIERKTMLWTALKSGRMAAVQSLVKAGADVTLQNERERTPLHHLALVNNSTTADDDYDQCRIVMDTIRLIITVGRGDVNIPDQYGHTPLHYLFKCRTLTTEYIHWVITEGKGDLDVCEQNMSTPLHYLCGYSGLQHDTVQLLIREGKGDFKKGDEYGSTPLHFLCDNENIDIDVVRQIVHTSKGDINKQDANGNTPLHFLCRRREINADILQEQLNQIPEADMEKQNCFGHTPQEYLTDLDDRLPLTERTIRRSPADLVLCTFPHEDRKIIVLAPAMTLSSEKVHRFLQVEDFSQELTNMAWSGGRDRPGRFRGFEGTCSSPVPVPPSPSPFSLPTYWETHSRLTWRKGVVVLLQMGVVEGEDHLDEGICVSHLVGSVCVSVREACIRHIGCLCIQVKRRDQEYRIGILGLRSDQIGNCVTLPLPTPGEEITFKFGLVLDVGRGRVGFIDVERGEILGKVDKKFTEWVFPLFCIKPFGDCPTRMRLVSGREISKNDRKIQLIQQVLTD